MQVDYSAAKLSKCVSTALEMILNQDLWHLRDSFTACWWPRINDIIRYIKLANIGKEYRACLSIRGLILVLCQVADSLHCQTTPSADLTTSAANSYTPFKCESWFLESPAMLLNRLLMYSAQVLRILRSDVTDEPKGLRRILQNKVNIAEMG